MAAFTQQEIDQISKEIEDFKARSMQYAATSAFLSAHYNRLYMVSKRSLKGFDRIKRSLEDRAYKEKRKQARQGASARVSGGTKKQSA